MWSEIASRLKLVDLVGFCDCETMRLEKDVTVGDGTVGCGTVELPAIVL